MRASSLKLNFCGYIPKILYEQVQFRLNYIRYHMVSSHMQAVYKLGQSTLILFQHDNVKGSRSQFIIQVL